MSPVVSGLVENEPVPDDECWLRVLTNKRHVTIDGTVHPQALRGGAFKASPPDKDWAHELSGNLVSRVDNVMHLASARVNEAQQGYHSRGQTVPSSVKFVGVACAKAGELRAAVDHLSPREVIYSPKLSDPAHADFVTFGTSEDTLDPVRGWLIVILRVIRPENIDAQLSACGGSPL